jgi:succinoglycan biosynthesis transport protein ExoP
MNIAAERDMSLRPVLGEPEDEHETLDMVRYWRAIARNKWRILALVAAVGILAQMYASSLPPIYRATATILVEASKPKLVSIEEVYSSMAGAQKEYYQTQLEILKSRELAAKLVRQMKLTEHPQYKPGAQPPAFYEKWLPKSLAGDNAAAVATPDQIERRVIRAVQGGIGLQLVRNSQLMRISFDSHDAELAAAVPNALADIYIESDLESRMQMTRKASAFLTGQTAGLKKKVTEAEQALQAFREREKIIDTKASSQTGVASQVEALTASLIDARRRRNEAEYAWQQVSALAQGKSQESLENLPAIQKYPAVLKLREVEAEAERRHADASKRYGAEHPRMVAADTELKSARENLRRGLAGAVQTVTREYESARANEAAIERTLSGAKGEVQNLNRKEFQLAALEREVATSRQFYDMFIQRFKETNISGEMHSPIARVIDPAILPVGAAGPNKRLIVGMSLLAALILAMSLALLLERLDNTVKTTHEVESRLGVAVLGILNITRVKSGQQLERVFLEDPQTTFSEAIRTIRSGVMLSSIDSPKKIVLVTSSVPEEGKTTVAANLAFALGQIKKTLLIDADMRRPKIGRVLGGANSNLAGLSQLVTGEATLERCVYPVQQGSQLFVLPAGRIPPNPLELLASHRFTDAMDRLAANFDVIVIDSPPVQLVSDALVLSNIATDVVYVVKADDTPYPLARMGIRRLRRVNAPILGVVLNQLDVLRADRYYGEYSGYGRRYHSKKYSYGYTPKGDESKA